MDDGRRAEPTCCDPRVVTLQSFSCCLCADSLTSGGEQDPLHTQPSLQDHSRRDVRHLWEIRADSADPSVSSRFMLWNGCGAFLSVVSSSLPRTLFPCVLAVGTRLRPEEPPTWSMRTSSTPRTPAITCPASTSATDTWWFCTTTPTEYVWIYLWISTCFVSLFCPCAREMCQLTLHGVFSLPLFQAFQKMDTKKKEEQLKLLKEKYGINTDPPK